jgi:hypothetical protein
VFLPTVMIRTPHSLHVHDDHDNESHRDEDGRVLLVTTEAGLPLFERRSKSSSSIAPAPGEFNVCLSLGLSLSLS